MAGAIVVLYVFDVRLALVVTASVPLVLIVSSVARKRARDAFRNQRRWTSKVNSFIAEHLSGIDVVKLFVRETPAKAQFAAHDAELMKANLGEMHVFATFRPAVDFLATLTTAIALCAGAGLYLSHSISLGTLIAFVNLIGMFYSPIKDLAEKYIMLQSAMAGGERIFTLLDADEMILDAPTIEMPSRIRGHIEFDKVWFAYKGEEWVLKDLSFTVEPGQMVAIVGYTGAGKTTVANLVTRFWDIQKGRYPHRRAFRARPAPGRAPQGHPGRCRRTSSSSRARSPRTSGWARGVAEERMKLARPRPSTPTNSSRRSPAGYDTELSEGGSNLSQGQRQLLSFAPRPRPRPGDHHPGRGHELGRHRDRKAHPARHRRAPRGADERGYRPPPLDDPQRRQDHRPGPGTDRRDGHPRRADREEGPVLEPLPAAEFGDRVRGFARLPSGRGSFHRRRIRALSRRLQAGGNAFRADSGRRHRAGCRSLRRR